MWNFVKAFNEREISAPLPSSVYVVFTNSVMTQGIREHHDLTVRVIGRCVGALVASKLAADINSGYVSAGDDELACISAILGTTSNDVVLLLRHPGAIELTNIVFLASANNDTASARVSSEVLDVVQQAFGVLSQELPAELNATMRLDQKDTMVNTSGSQCNFILLSCLYGLHVYISDFVPHP
jgi:hypothetical protein